MPGQGHRERPLPGLAHAFVFWGFLAFALVSLNHFAAGFGLGFLDADGWLGGFYFWFAAIFALLVAVSIAGLFVRRFFVRPIWLGRKVSYESGVIAFLIFALMVTYLAAFMISSASAAGAWPVVGACALHPGLSAADPAHQTPAPGSEPDHDIPLARRVQPYTAAGRRRGLRPGDRQGCHAARRAAGLFLRRMRPLHRALPRREHGQGAEPQRGHSGRAQLSERPRPAFRGAAARQIQLAGGGLPVHHLRRLRIPVPGRHRAPAHHHWVAARRGKHRRLGRRLRHQAVPRAGAQRQCAWA